MGAKMKLTFNHAQVKAKIQAGANAALPVLSEQVLKDSNFYAREDTKTMINSSQYASDLKKGEIVWETPYAKRVYYTGTPSHDKNVNATLMWFETAKTTCLKTWLKIAEKAFKAGM